MRRFGTLAAALLAVGLLGAVRESGPPGGGFPTPERLEDLKKTPLPEGSFDRPEAMVDAWTLTGPFPNVVAAAPYRDPSNWGALLERAANRRAGLVVTTEPMHCAAREWGLFYLANEAPPGPDLRDFFTARCTAVAPGVQYYRFSGIVPEGASDEEVFERWSADIDAMLEEHLVGGPLTTGIWFGRSAGRAVVVVASGQRTARIDPLPTVFEEGDGSFTVRGELLAPAGILSATVNVGDYETAACTPNPDRALPRFEFACKVDRSDDRSWLILSATPPGRILSRGVLSVLLSPSGKPSDEWQRRGRGEPILLVEGLAVEEALLGRINEVRARAGRDPLALEPEQSATNRDFAPLYFGSLFGIVPPQSGDLAVLGVLAGYDVDAIVRDASFTAAWSTQSKDLDRLVATALEYPGGREALLAPEADRLAIGALAREEDDYMATVFSTYALFDESRHDAVAAKVLEKLDAKRASAGKRPVRHLIDVASLTHVSARRVKAGENPHEVLDDVMEQAVTILQRGVRGWVIYTSDPETVEFHRDMIEIDSLEVAIGVSHAKIEEDLAWGRYVILVIGAEPEEN